MVHHIKIHFYNRQQKIAEEFSETNSSLVTEDAIPEIIPKKGNRFPIGKND